MPKVKIYEHKKTKQLFLFIPRRKFKDILDKKKKPKYLDVKEENMRW